ncbi:hypothetical protein D5086_009227 [Populus alba]|uniref:Uncharacterized protein n=1 Tax=Populus alba TaxID=43335 RepID=A0ACC4CHW3_POPAL
MELGSVLQFLENKTILVTGATGAVDAKSARERLHDEVIGKELFKVIREKHGASLHSFISEKVAAVPGDISYEELGVKDCSLKDEMWREIDVVLNFAATTNFDERYDVALGINTLGALHVLNFAKKCVNVKMLVHVSTGEARRFGWPNTYVFTKAMGEMLVVNFKDDLPVLIIRPTMVASTYKEPFPGWIEGVRTIDSIIVGYGKGKVSCFISGPQATLDVIPADMVVNAITVAMVARARQHPESVYHLGSSLRNPVNFSNLHDFSFRYFSENPWINKEGEAVKIGRGTVLSSMSKFYTYMTIRYLLPLKALQLFNTLLFKRYQDEYTVLDRKLKLVMRLVDLYKPYVFFEGIFDDMNAEKLRIASRETCLEADVFDFDPVSIDWEDYMMNAHIPGLVKYVMK